MPGVHLCEAGLLFIPVMSILLGISPSLHTTCCAQQCGEAGASGGMVSVRQSQSQGSVSSHQSEEKPCPDVCLSSIFFTSPPQTDPSFHYLMFDLFCFYKSHAFFFLE